MRVVNGNRSVLLQIIHVRQNARVDIDLDIQIRLEEGDQLLDATFELRGVQVAAGSLLRDVIELLHRVHGVLGGAEEGVQQNRDKILGFGQEGGTERRPITARHERDQCLERVHEVHDLVVDLFSPIVLFLHALVDIAHVLVHGHKDQSRLLPLVDDALGIFFHDVQDAHIDLDLHAQIGIKEVGQLFRALFERGNVDAAVLGLVICLLRQVVDLHYRVLGVHHRAEKCVQNDRDDVLCHVREG